MQIQLGSLKCSGKNGIYPSEIELEEKRALEKRLKRLNFNWAHENYYHHNNHDDHDNYNYSIIAFGLS